MSELNTLRRMRASLAEPEPVRLAAVRSQVTARFDEREPRARLPRMGVRLVAVGALAVTIAAGVTVAQNLGDVDENGHRRTGVPGLPAGPVASAGELAHRAALKAATEPAWNPRPDQWTYVKEMFATSSAGTAGFLAGRPDGRITVERWLKVDGMRRATKANGGRLESVPTTPMERSAVPRSDYAYLRSLPTDPKALLALVYQRSGRAPLGRDAAAFSAIQVLMSRSVLPPKLRAALYGALAAIPGVRLDKDVTDAAGRHGVALYRIDEGYLRTDVIIDPATYAYLGHRAIAVNDHASTGTEGTSRSKKGQILGWSAQLATAIVDRSGARR
ncbi:CU044_5270 family protein [Actinomadura roseirufa]|uniref:CU044_5270 family protein n=1 Tax=Actinomadura roseirufa TaxID=2094049 RepID=UPI0010418678|nr:CU044_5270 family protein [Actinomadura roseirufa]